MTPWTVAYQVPPSIGFSRQECWSGLPFPSPGGLPDPGIEPGSPTLQADALLSEPPGKKPLLIKGVLIKKKSNYTTAFEASAQTIKDHICSHPISQSYTSSGEQKNAPLTGRLCEPGTKKRVYNVLIREGQINVIKTTIYHMAFFPQSCMMASGALAILSQSGQKETGREKKVPNFPQELQSSLSFSSWPKLDHMSSHMRKVTKTMVIELVIQRSWPYSPASGLLTDIYLYIV